MSKDYNIFDFDDENPLDDIIQEEDKKLAEQQGNEALSIILKQLVEAVNGTNNLLSVGDSNTTQMKAYLDVLKNALTRPNGENIADFISTELEKHQQALSKSGIDVLNTTTENLKNTLDRVEKRCTVILNNAQSKQKSIETQLEEVKQTFEEVAEALKKPRKEVLDSGDRYLLSNVGNAVESKISKQKWWWVGLGAGLLFSLFLSGYGTYRLIEAKKEINRAQQFYANDEYVWTYWQYMKEEWGKANPKTYKSIIDQFKEKYPEYKEKYERAETEEKNPEESH